MCGDVMTCAGTCSQAQNHEPPQKLEELRQLKRGFPGFLLSTKVKKNLYGLQFTVDSLGSSGKGLESRVR